MRKKIGEYKIYFSNKQILKSFALAILFFVISLIINYYAGTYATESASNSVTDIILSNIRVYDLDGTFVYGTISLFFFILFVIFSKPQRISFIVKSISLFYIIRSIFISLTHIGPFPSQLLIESNLLDKITFGGDLFFSGHTGLPFLLALIFWEKPIIRNIFICFSLSFGVVVLLTHMHYSIDVLSAFFITYSIFHIARYLFKRDYNIFHKGLENQDA